MSREEIHAAVLAFLDQFINRGAAADILALRERLATDSHTRAALDGLLPSDQPSEREAFDAMHAFFEASHPSLPASREGEGPDLIDLISWTGWARANEKGLFDEAGLLEMTADPAQWHDWLTSVERARTTL
jgi:hypothetical protein